jgi:transposase-like protein
MTDGSIIATNQLRGIQAEINRLQIMLEEKRDIRTDYIKHCLNNGVPVKDIAAILKISMARVYKILETV